MEIRLSIEVNVHHHHGGPSLGNLLDAVATLTRKVNTMSQALTDAIATLTDKVDAIDSAEDSARALIEGIPAMIQTAIDAAVANGVQPEQLAALDALAARIGTEAESLAAAVVANTPVDPTA